MDNKALELLKNDPRINGSIDLVCGGPPCQGFSGIGHRRTHDVEKETIPTNHLFKEMARVIRVLSPKAFLFENVKGILSGKWTKDGKMVRFFGMFGMNLHQLKDTPFNPTSERIWIWSPSKQATSNDSWY